MAATYDDLTDRLTAIAEELGDLALQHLREAVEQGHTGPVAEEKRLTRARRAVEKAVHLLEAGDRTAADD